MTEPRFAKLEAENRRLQNELSHILGSTRFRVGSCLVNSLEEPRSVFANAQELYSLFREYRMRRIAAEIQIGLEVGQPNNPISELAQGQTFDVTGSSVKELSALKRSVYESGSKLPREGQMTGAFGQTASKRVQELRTLTAAHSSSLFPPPKSNFAPNDKGEIVMVLHSGLPMQVNGYGVRSDSLLRGLLGMGLRMSAALRGEDTEAISAPYRAIGDICPEDRTLMAYIDAYAAALETTYERRPVRLVHGVSNFVTGIAAGKFARSRGVPFVYEVRGLWEITRQSVQPNFSGSLGFGVQKALETQCAKEANRVITISGPLKAELVARGVPADRIDIVGNATALPQEGGALLRTELRTSLGVEDDEVLIGFVGSITSYEGLDILLKALRRTIGRGCKAKLVVVGEGEAMHRLREDVRALRLEQYVTLSGALAPRKAARMHTALDLTAYVRPDSPVSRLVPPLKPLQSLAYGIPTIVADTPAMTELVGMGVSSGAVLCEPDSVAALAKTLEGLCRSPARRRELGRLAKIWVRDRATWRHACSKVADIYEEVSGAYIST